MVAAWQWLTVVGEEEEEEELKHQKQMQLPLIISMKHEMVKWKEVVTGANS